MSMAALGWFLFNIVTIAILAFFSMMEMACVSFNKVRLQYYVTKGIKQAVWLNNLLQNPTKLFGTTLIGVNVATVVGSECAREFYSSLGLSPDIAPLTQVVLVVIFGELAPMFAARHFPEHMVMIGTPLLYASAQLMKPLLWAISSVTSLCNLFLNGNVSESKIFLNREELEKILEGDSDERDEFNTIAANIFKLRHIRAREIMKPLSNFKVLSSNSTVTEMREVLARKSVPFFPIYHRSISNIVGIAYPRDMLRASDNHRVRDESRAVWFVTLNTPVMEILQQFRRNKQSVAVVIDEQGTAVGLIPLDTLIEVLVATGDEGEEIAEEAPKVIIDRTLPGDMQVGEFNKKFGVILDNRTQMTLAELIVEDLGHEPEEGDSIFLDPYQLTVKELSMTEIVEVSVSTKIG